MTPEVAKTAVRITEQLRQSGVDIDNTFESEYREHDEWLYELAHSLTDHFCPVEYGGRQFDAVELDVDAAFETLEVALVSMNKFPALKIVVADFSLDRYREWNVAEIVGYICMALGECTEELKKLG